MQIKQEIYRKLFHICLSVIPVIYLHLGKERFLMYFSILTTTALIIDYARCKSNKIASIITPIFRIIMREKELSGNSLSSLSWTFIGTLINFSFFHPIIAVTGFLILTYADAMGAIIGKSIKSKKFYQKSQAGSLAFFITSILVITGCGLYFDCRLAFFLFAIFVSIFVTYLEAYPDLFHIDDNLLLPLAFGLCMTLLNFMWHFL